MRVPRVAGVGGGVGTSLLAHALRAIDDGVYASACAAADRGERLYRGGDADIEDGFGAGAGVLVDVLVARTTVTSLSAAHRAIAQAPYPPVLAVVCDIPAPVPAPVRAQIRMVSPHVTDAIAVPYVAAWRQSPDPYAAAAQVLDPQIVLPKALLDFAKALRRLAGAVEPLLHTHTPAAPGEHLGARPMRWPRPLSG